MFGNDRRSEAEEANSQQPQQTKQGASHEDLPQRTGFERTRDEQQEPEDHDIDEHNDESIRLHDERHQQQVECWAHKRVEQRVDDGQQRN